MIKNKLNRLKSQRDVTSNLTSRISNAVSTRKKKSDNSLKGKNFLTKLKKSGQQRLLSKLSEKKIKSGKLSKFNSPKLKKGNNTNSFSIDKILNSKSIKFNKKCLNNFHLKDFLTSEQNIRKSSEYRTKNKTSEKLKNQKNHRIDSKMKKRKSHKNLAINQKKFNTFSTNKIKKKDNKKINLAVFLKTEKLENIKLRKLTPRRVTNINLEQEVSKRELIIRPKGSKRLFDPEKKKKKLSKEETLFILKSLQSERKLKNQDMFFIKQDLKQRNKSKRKLSKKIINKDIAQFRTKGVNVLKQRNCSKPKESHFKSEKKIY